MQADAERSNALALTALRRGEELFAESPYWQTHGVPAIVSVDLYSDRGLTLQVSHPTSQPLLTALLLYPSQCFRKSFARSMLPHQLVVTANPTVFFGGA